MSDQTFKITPYGLLMSKMDERSARDAIESLELHCRRHHVAIAVDTDDTFRFVQLESCEQAPDPLADHPQLPL
jgi:hypothetical protein